METRKTKKGKTPSIAEGKRSRSKSVMCWFSIRKFFNKLIGRKLIFGIDEPHESDYGAYVEGYIDKKGVIHITKEKLRYERSGSASGSIQSKTCT